LGVAPRRLGSMAASGVTSPAPTRTRVTPPQAKPEADSYRRVVRAFNEVAGALAAESDSLEGDDLDRFMHLIAAKICELVDVRRCSLYLRDERSELFRGQVGHAGRDIDAKVKRLVAGVPADRFTQEILRTRKPVLLRSALRDPRPIHSTMRAWSIKAMLGVPMVLGDEVIGLIFLDNEDRPHRFSEEHQEIAAAFANLAADAIRQAQLTARLRANQSTLESQNAILKRAAVVEERLAELVLEQANLGRIAQAVAELTERPCFLHDARRAPIGAGTPESVPQHASLLEPRFRGSAEVEASLEMGRKKGKRAHLAGPFPALGLNRRFLIAPIAARGECWGHLVLVEQGTGFGALDMLVARRAATIVALEISAEARAASAHWDASSSLVSELLRRGQDLEALQRRAECVGTDLTAPHVLVQLAPRRAEGAGPPSARDLVEALADLDGGRTPLATGTAEGPILMVALDQTLPPREAVAQIRDAIRAACDRLLPEGAVVAGLSTVCREPGDYAEAFEEVHSLIGAIDELAADGANVAMGIDELGAGRILMLGVNEPSGRRYIEDVIGPLLDPEDSRAADLLTTLEAYLDCSRSIRRCAERLELHDNTIRYRLGRIEELLGLEITTDGEAQLSVQMALVLVRLRGASADA